MLGENKPHMTTPTSGQTPTHRHSNNQYPNTPNNPTTTATTTPHNSTDTLVRIHRFTLTLNFLLCAHSAVP